MFDNEIDSTVNFLREVGGKGIQQHGTDVWEWSGDPSGNYSTRSAYNLIYEDIAGGQQEEWCDSVVMISDAI